MKHLFKLMLAGLCLLLPFACENDDSIRKDSLVILDKLTASGKIGDMIDVTVRFGSNDISRLVVEKYINGVKKDFTLDVPVKGSSEVYNFSQMILAGDQLGPLVYTMNGYDAAGNLRDATDLLVTVELAGVPLLTRYDWQQYSQTIDGFDFTDEYLTDDVHRFHEDHLWEFDWGVVAPGDLVVLNQFCSWTIAGSESKVDSLHLIKFGFLQTQPTYDRYKVVKLEGTDLWLESTVDLSFIEGFSAESKVVDKFSGIIKSSDFTPYRGEPAENYSWGECLPGTY